MHAESVGISNEPLIRAIHRRIVEIALVSYSAFIIYISFVPFDLISSPPQDRSGPGFFWGLSAPGANIPDIFANIGIYIPLGALGWIVGRRLKLGWLKSILCATSLPVLLSFAIEQSQYWIASRVSSWVDVIANGLGAAVGAICINFWSEPLIRLLDQIRDSARRNWWSAASKCVVCLLLLLHLRPYDVVVDVTHTAAAMRYADVSPLAAWHGLHERVESEIDAGRRSGISELPRVQWEYALDRIVDVVGYAALSILLSLGIVRRNRTHSSLRTDAWIGFVVVSLAMIVTVIRIFLISHGFDTAHFFCGILGWVIGCTIARSIRPSSAQPSRSELPRSLILLAMAGAIAVPVLYELVPFDFETGGLSSISYHWLFSVPFAKSFLSRPNDAFYDITGEMLRYCSIGICIAIMFLRTRLPWRGQVAAGVLITGMISFVLETVHLAMNSRVTDVTNLLIAMIASLTGAIAVRWVTDYRASLSVVVADDLLTSQLIEGESYDKQQALPTATPETKKQSATS